MIILDMPQGSIKWIANRLWRLTASTMKGSITATGALSRSEAALDKIDKLIAGQDVANMIAANPGIFDNMDDWQVQKWLANYTGEKFTGNLHTRRGNDCEPDALAAMAEKIKSEISEVGMCIMGNDINGVVSCSPDGHVYHGGRLVAGAEVKAPTLATYYGYVRHGGLPDDYKIQVHAGMAVCEVEKWHFGAYFAGKPLHYVCVQRDKFTDTLAKSLNEFSQLYADCYYKVTEKLSAMSAQAQPKIEAKEEEVV